MKQILVVDDDLTMNALLRDFLKRRGYGVTVTTSVTGALGWLKLLQADLVLSDVKLGSSSGIDLAKTLSVERPELPVVLFSVFDEIEGEALSSGARRFIRKPFSLETLAKALAEELDGAPAKRVK